MFKKKKKILNKNVLSLGLKTSRLQLFWIEAGSWFHSLGPEIENVQSAVLRIWQLTTQKHFNNKYSERENNWEADQEQKKTYFVITLFRIIFSVNQSE